MVDGYRVIDGHVHTFSSEEVSRKIRESFNRIYSIEFENPGTGTIGDVLANMERIGVDRTIMANFAPPRIIHDNNLWTIEAACSDSRLIPLVSFHPDMEGDMSGLFGQYVRLGAKGVKLHPMAQGFSPLDKRLERMYGCCNEASLPVVFHCGRVANARLNEYSDLEMILPLVEKYPAIPFVLTHMADGNARDVVETAKSFGNVSFDTSIVITGYPPIMETNDASWLDDEEVAGVINTIGAERVIFGSDYPWGSPLHDIPRIMALKLDEEQKRGIFSENAVRIFGLEI
jgi:predicted TIM-barrel fold metal-dependent hydrolase